MGAGGGHPFALVLNGLSEGVSAGKLPWFWMQNLTWGQRSVALFFCMSDICLHLLISSIVGQTIFCSFLFEKKWKLLSGSASEWEL